MRLLKNSIFSLGAAVIPTVIGLVSVPLFVSTIGMERYGVMIVAWILLGYFGQADFGIGRAITQRVSSAIDHSDAFRAEAVASAFASCAVFSAVSAALTYLAASLFFAGPFDIDEAIRAEILSAIWALALAIPVIAMSGVASGALMGVERFGASSLGNLIGQSCVQVLPLLYALFVGIDVGALILCSVSGRALGLIYLFVPLWREFFRNNRFRVVWGQMKDLTKFGIWVMVSALVGPLMLVGDRFVIGSIAGAVAVAAYSIPFQLAARTQLLPISLVHALFPRFASEDPGSSKQRCEDYTIFVAQIFAPVILVLICLTQPFLELWLGANLDQRSIAVGHVLFGAFWINAIANVPYAYIQASGNPRFTAKLHLAELPVYAVLLLLFGLQYGLIGFAIAFGLRCVIDCTALAWRSGAQIGALASAIAPHAFLILLVIFAISRLDSFGHLLLAAAATSSISFLLSLFQMPSTIRNRLAQIPLVSRTPVLRKFIEVIGTGSAH